MLNPIPALGGTLGVSQSLRGAECDDLSADLVAAEVKIAATFRQKFSVDDLVPHLQNLAHRCANRLPNPPLGGPHT